MFNTHFANTFSTRVCKVNYKYKVNIMGDE